MKILIVEDDPFTRSTLAGALSHEGVEVALSTGSAGEAMEFVKNQVVDAALLDLDLGIGPTGLDLAHALRRRLPEVGLVLLSSFADPRLTGRNLPDLPLGASYIEKRTIGDTSFLVD
jgi:CheY-like chemotaxis protein